MRSTAFEDFRSVATRQDKLAADFLSAVALVTAVAFWAVAFWL